MTTRTRALAHTKGPWTVERPQRAANGIVEVQIYAVTPLPDGRRAVRWGVCTLRSAAKGEAKETIANANLIAAAPDMLDALDAVATEIDTRGIVTAIVMDTVRAAIAKATSTKEPIDLRRRLYIVQAEHPFVEIKSGSLHTDRAAADAAAMAIVNVMLADAGLAPTPVGRPDATWQTELERVRKHLEATSDVAGSSATVEIIEAYLD